MPGSSSTRATLQTASTGPFPPGSATRGGGAAAAFSPADDADLALWLRADLGIADTGGLVDSWTSQAGDAVLTGSGAGRPTLGTSATYGGRAVLTFAGSQFVRDTLYTTISQPYIAIVVGRSTSGATQIVIDDGGTGADSPAIFFATGQWQGRGGTSSLLSGVTSVSAPLAQAVVANGASSAYYAGNDFTTASVSGVSGTVASQSLTVGANNSGTGGLNGEVAEVIITRATAAILATYRDYINTRYGLSLA